jgi:hypothetical protein
MDCYEDGSSSLYVGEVCTSLETHAVNKTAYMSLHVSKLRHQGIILSVQNVLKLVTQSESDRMTIFMLPAILSVLYLGRVMP